MKAPGIGKVFFFCLLFLFSLVGCLEKNSSSQSSNTPPAAPPPTPPSGNLSVYRIRGVTQKGPFAQGSTITIQELDETLSPTGLTYSTQTSDYTGSFRINSELKSSLVEIIATGYYFDEVKGGLSDSTLTLRVYADLKVTPLVNVNILTSLAHDRIFQLVENGSSFFSAQSQAEQEVLSALNIKRTSSMPFSQMDISQSGDDNAILLAASAILQGRSTVAQLSELLAQMGSDLAHNGQLTNANLTQSLVKNSTDLDLASVRQNLLNRYQSFGIQASIPAFETLIDRHSTIASISPAFGNISGGYIVQITGSNFLPGSMVYIGLSPCQAVVVISSTQISCQVGVALNPGTYNVSVIDPYQKSVVLSSGFRYHDLNVSPKVRTLVVNQSLNFLASGGTPPYTYASDVGSISSSGVYLAPGSSSQAIITVTDAASNTAQAIISINPPLFTPLDIKSLSLNESFQVEALYGVPPYHYSASFGQISDAGLFTAGSSALSSTISITDADGTVINLPVVVSSGWAGVREIGSARVFLKSLIVDSLKNVYATGSTNSGLDQNQQQGSWDLFLIKYNSLGQKLFTKQIGVPGELPGGYFLTSAGAIALDAEENVYVSGFANGLLGGTGFSTKGKVFVIKFNPLGQVLWISQFDPGVLVTLSSDNYTSLAIAPSGNIYVGGGTSKFIAKLSPTGEKLWVQGTPSDVAGLGLDAEENVFSGGTYNYSVLYLFKFDKNGNSLWINSFTPENARGQYVAYALSVDASGNPLVSGYTNIKLSDNSLLLGAVGWTAFVMKFDLNGHLLWQDQLLESTGFSRATAIKADSSGNVLMAGVSSGALIGNAQTNQEDLFLVKYSPDGSRSFVRQKGSYKSLTGVSALSVDASGDIYLGGQTAGGLNGNAAIGFQDGFLLKYSSSGEFQ